MPFQVSKDSATRPNVQLEVRGPRTFELLTSFVYLDETDQAHPEFSEVPKNHETDLASVPSFLWGLLASYGHQTLPALLHDHLWEVDDLPAGTTPLAQRLKANRLFLAALNDEHVRFVRRHLFWGGVMLDAYRMHAKVRFLAIVLHLLLATTTVWLVFVAEAPWIGARIAVRSSGPGWLEGLTRAADFVQGHGLLMLAVVAASSLVWQRFWSLIVVGAFALPIVIAEGAVTLVSAFALWVPDQVTWLVQRALAAGPGNVPAPGPSPSLRPSKMGLS